MRERTSSPRAWLASGCAVFALCACSKTLELAPESADAATEEPPLASHDAAMLEAWTWDDSRTVLQPGTLTEGPPQLQWAESLGGPAAVTALAVSGVPNLDGNPPMLGARRVLYVSGRFGSKTADASLHFGTQSVGGRGAFLVPLVGADTWSDVKVFSSPTLDGVLTDPTFGIDRQGGTLGAALSCTGPIDLGAGAVAPVGSSEELCTATYDIKNVNPVLQSSQRWAGATPYAIVMPLGIVAGRLERPTDLGGGTLTGQAFVLDGQHSWSHGLDAPTISSVRVAVDGEGGSLGRIYVAGAFTGSLSIGNQVLQSAGSSDVFVAAFDLGGGLVWAKRFGDGSDQGSQGIVVASRSNVGYAFFYGDPGFVVAGGFSGTIDFGAGPLTSAGDTDVFVVRFAPDGSPLWSKSFGSPGAQAPTAITIDDYDGTILTGSYGGTLDFGGGALPAPRAQGCFLAKLDQHGRHVWSRGFGDDCSPLAVDVSATCLESGLGDCDTQTVFGGSFRGAVDFGAGPLSTGDDAGQTDNAFVAVFTTHENWAQ